MGYPLSFLWPAAILVGAIVPADVPAQAASLAMATPAGFADLAAPQQALVDVYYGGVRVGEAQATFAPGLFRFEDPQAVARIVPDIADRAAVAAALAAPSVMLADRCAAAGDHARCAPIVPAVAAIGFDQRLYRVDLFVNPRLLTVRAATARRYLPMPQLIPSMIHSISGTVSGTAGRSPRYYWQDQALLGFGAGRVRALLSQSSEGGFRADTLAVDLDRPGVRYTAGAFWLPGNDLVGRRRIVGGGVGSQFDTRLDRQQFEGSPLVLFLDERAKVEMLVGGRLVAARFYEAGSQALDASVLPEGAYDVRLRITGASGRVTEERRFFSRSRLLPPVGHDVFFAYVGLPADDTRGPLGRIDGRPLFQAAWARRIDTGVAVNAGVTGGGHGQWLNGGLTVIDAAWQAEGALVVSSRGGFGGYAHVSSAGRGRLSYDLDARLVSTPEAGAFPPRSDGLHDAGATYDPGAAYAQLSGTASWQLAEGGRLALTGTYRRVRGTSDYAFGPSLRLSIWRDRNATLGLNGNYAITGRGGQGYVGLALRLNRGGVSYGAEGGIQRAPDPGKGRMDAVGALSATMRASGLPGIEAQATGGLVRDGRTDYGMAQADAHGQAGEMMLNLIQPLGGAGPRQYGVSLHSNLVMRPDALAFAGGTAGDSVVIAQVDAASPADRYDVLVGEVPVATIAGGDSAVVTLPSYRAYDLRIRARGAALTDYDSKTRTIGLYPGTVARMRWTAETMTAVFGRLVSPGGRAVADADIVAGREVAQTDGEGRFMIQIGAGRRLVARLPGGGACAAAIGPLQPADNYAAIGDVTCRTIMTGEATPAVEAGTKG